MAFCPYCGKQTADGEVCPCTTVHIQQTGTGSAVSYSSLSGSTPPPPPPAAPRPAVSPTPPVADTPVEGAAPQSSFAPPAGFTSQTDTAVPEGAAPQSGFAPQSSFIPPDEPARKDEPEQDRDPAASVAAPQSGFAPQSSYGPPADFAPQQSTYSPPPPPAPAPKGESVFVASLKTLLERVKNLFSARSDKAVEDALSSSDISWSALFGAYVLFGTLAASFAIPRYSASALDVLSGLSYGDVLGEQFGGILWRSLLVNILALVLAFGVTAGALAASKVRLSLYKTLNLVSLAFVPAAALNVLGLLFSFFFPAGTLLCGVISSVCTVVILSDGLVRRTGKQNLWFRAIITGALVLGYMLIAWLLMGDSIAPIALLSFM